MNRCCANVYHTRASFDEHIYGVSFRDITMEGILYEAELPAADFFTELLARPECRFVCRYLFEKNFILFYFTAVLIWKRNAVRGANIVLARQVFVFYRLLHYFRSCAKQPLRQKEELDVSAACGDIRLCMYQRRFDAGRHDSALRGSYPVGGGH